MSADMRVIQTLDDLHEMVKAYQKFDAWAFDVETRGPDRVDPLVAEVSWISFAGPGRADVIPMSHPNGNLDWERPAPLLSGRRKMANGRSYESLPKSDISDATMERKFLAAPKQIPRYEVMQVLEPLFFSRQTKIGHNVKFDLHAVSKYYLGAIPDPPYFDTLIASWLLDATLKGRYSLAACVDRELGEDLEKGIGKNVDEHSFEDVASYSLLDADSTWRLYLAIQKKMIKRPELKWLINLEMSVLSPVLEMEATGSRIDVDLLQEIGSELDAEIDDLVGQAHRIAGRSFNLNSPKQKQEVLFASKKNGGQGLRPVKPTATGKKTAPEDRTIYDYSVDNETLEHHERNPLVKTMIQYAKKGKLHTTYVVPYLGGTTNRGGKEKPVESRLRDGRVYSQFIQHGTESGRFSSKNPNLQNIPSRSADGRRLRKIFIADPGHTLIVADYSQIEPRIIASLSGDKTMINTYLSGGDVYQAVADRIGVSRAMGKELVLSIAYGVGPATIAAKTGITETAARDLMEYFIRQFPLVQKLKHQTVLKAKQRGYAETIFKRRRNLEALNWSSMELRSKAERQAFNHLVQGSAADIMKIALVNIYSSLPPGSKMLMTVHDEAMVQSPDNDVSEVKEIVRREMENARPKRIVVPLVADVGTGPNWLEAK